MKRKVMFRELNETQIISIEGAIKFPINDIIQTFIAEPKKAILAINAILSGADSKTKCNTPFLT